MDDAGMLKHTMIWAWMSGEAGLVRARTFSSDWGIPEDEANGSGVMKLALELERYLEVRHGQGSEIFVRLVAKSRCMVGGRVIVK